MRGIYPLPLYKTGDVIVKSDPGIQTRRYVVADPARTTAGKLRLRRENGTILTAWWGLRGDSWLPPHYRLETESMDIVTLHVYKAGVIREVEPRSAMTEIFAKLKAAGFLTQGSTDRFEATDRVDGTTWVFEVQDKRSVS